MAGFSAGSAEAVYLLNIDQPRRAAQELRALFASIKTQAAGVSGAVPRAAALPGARAAPDPALVQQRAERAILARANAEARLAQIQNTGANAARGLAQAETIYAQALAKVDQTSVAAIRTQSQLAAVQNRLKSVAGGGLPVLPRTVESFGTVAIEQFKSGILGVVGPAALATAGLAALTGTVETFKRAFLFKAELDATTKAIEIQLRGVRDSGATFASAAAFADKYRFTQLETTNALRGSVSILRTSKTSAEELLGVLARLQVLSPEQGLEGAALALKELTGGDVQSLVERFEVSRAAANKMKDEIKGGGDAVKVLGAFLNDAGINMDTLKLRAEGAAGALNASKVAAEELALAQGRIAESKGGILIVQEQARLYRGLANLLNGDVITGLKATATEFVALQAGQEAYNAAIAAGRTEIQAAAIQQQVYNDVLRQAQIVEGLLPPEIQNHTKAIQAQTGALQVNIFALSEESKKKLESQIATAQLSQEQAQLERDSIRAANGLLGAGDQALLLAQKYGIATAEAQFLINAQQALSNATALANQRKQEQTGTQETAAQFNNFATFEAAKRKRDTAEAKTASDKAATDANRLADLRTQNALINARTSAQKIAILQRQLAGTTDAIERQQLQNQIDQERQSGTKRVGGAQTTALRLNDIARTSGDDRVRIERENLERLHDQQEDFEVRRARSQEDFERQRRRLLAEGRRAEAARLTETFNRDTRREQEDFDRDRRRALRNNQEAIDDQSTRVGNRVESINARTADRGGAPSIGGIAPPADLGVGGGGGGGTIALRLTIAPLPVVLDGQKVAELLFPPMEQLIDASLADEFGQLGITLSPSAQTAVTGAQP